MVKEKQEKQAFIRMIYDAFNSPTMSVGGLGELLLQRATELDKEPVKKEPLEEEAFVRKIKEFRVAEDNQNLVWIDYKSWNLLPDSFKKKVDEVLDPLFWAGVFFKFDQFLQHEETLVRLLDSTGYLYLLTEAKRNHTLVWVACDSVFYNWLQDSKMDELSRLFLCRLVKSYGRDSEGNPVVKMVESRKEVNI
jgi:hypothetical protein